VIKTENQIISRSHPEFSNEILRPNWGIFQAIRQNFKLHPHFTLFHVKGHQDDLSDQKDLPFPAKLSLRPHDLLFPAQLNIQVTNWLQQGLAATYLSNISSSQITIARNSEANEVNANSCGKSRRA
jgi:hypothetical protein